MNHVRFAVGVKTAETELHQSVEEWVEAVIENFKNADEAEAQAKADEATSVADERNGCYLEAIL